jgi:hypothetical protein
VTANDKIDKIYNLTINLLNEHKNVKFYVYVNKVNKFINITTDCNGRVMNVWSDGGNDIIYGIFTFDEAVAFAKTFSDLHHIEYRETFNIRTTTGSNNNTKAF